ncbi:MAG: KTSC domain-containing protein, partial [Cyanobacteria bacterium J06636_27]
MLPVASSMASAIGYDSDSEVLQIEFNNGAVYEYSDIDEDTWEDLYASDAVGK